MHIKTIASAAALAAGAFVVACGAERPPNTSADAPNGAFLVVTNDNLLDADVYAVAGSLRQRLGSARVAHTDTIPLRLTIVSGAAPVRIVTEPIGTAARHVSEPIVVDPGDWIELHIRNPLNLTSVTVWRP